MTDIELVRLKIGTVISGTFTDAQIKGFLDLEGDVLLAAAGAIESWAASQLGSFDSEKIGDYAYTRKFVTNALALAKSFRDSAAGTGLVDWTGVLFDDTLAEDE